MSEIAELIKQLNIPPEKMQQLVSQLQANPMAALSIVKDLSIPPEVMQKIVAIMVSNPSAIIDFAKNSGFGDDQLEMVESQMESIKQRLANQNHAGLGTEPKAGEPDSN